MPAPPITFLFVMSLCCYHFIIETLLFCSCSSIKFCLNDSSQTDTNSFLTPVFPAALFAISISNVFTSAIVSHGKTMVGTEGVIPFPVFRSFSSQIDYNMCFHFQLLLAFSLVSLLSLFLLKHLLDALFQHNYH